MAGSATTDEKTLLEQKSRTSGDETIVQPLDQAKQTDSEFNMVGSGEGNRESDHVLVENI